MNRLNNTFARLKQAGRAGLATYFSAGDPEYETCLMLLKGLGRAGADVIELGMPFSDPVADGPVLQQAHLRALAGGQTTKRTLALTRDLRMTDSVTPVVLMGYLNPVMQYGVDAFMAEAGDAGVDGIILVDLPIEHSAELRGLSQKHGIDLIQMSAPTSREERLAEILQDAGGFVYHIMLAGTTGAALPDEQQIIQGLNRVRAHTNLPIAAGFGVRTPEEARLAGEHADLVVIGSRLAETLFTDGVAGALAEVRLLAAALRD